MLPMKCLARVWHSLNDVIIDIYSQIHALELLPVHVDYSIIFFKAKLSFKNCQPVLLLLDTLLCSSQKACELSS